MDNFINFLNVKIVPVANKMGAQRHMMAIRKGIISTLPLTIVGSFFKNINNPTTHVSGKPDQFHSLHAFHPLNATF